MTPELIAFVLAFVADAADVERLRATAPTYLTSATARAHLGAARYAATRHDVDPSLLLAIAYNESRYTPTAQGPEAHGRVSCGVMTPEPKRRCDPDELTLVGGYLAGAAHLRGWLDACRGGLRCALTGYAGGYYLINYCRERQHPNCGAADRLLRRAARIRGDS